MMPQDDRSTPPTRAATPSPCPHCGLPPVLPEICTPDVNAAIERNIARDGEAFYAGMEHEAQHHVVQGAATPTEGESIEDWIVREARAISGPSSHLQDPEAVIQFGLRVIERLRAAHGGRKEEAHD
jgi:hypothetical protein